LSKVQRAPAFGGSDADDPFKDLCIAVGAHDVDGDGGVGELAVDPLDDLDTVRVIGKYASDVVSFVDECVRWI
jgi:hypothetical protein